MEAELLATGLPDMDLAFNLTWQDWLNLRSLIEVSRVMALAALQRQDSRGAHYREDFPAAGDLETSRFTLVRQVSGELKIEEEAVEFTRVRPGETLLKDAAAAE